MTALADAQDHLAKAREFLEAARFSHELDLYNAATSDAVVSGINSKDAICLKLVGLTVKSDDHQSAVRELKGAGAAGAGLAPTLSRLLRLKTKAQYQPSSVAAADAARAIGWACRMLEVAEQTVSTR